MTLGVADPQTSLFDLVIIGDGPFPLRLNRLSQNDLLEGG